jgi:hypothetical protein
MEYWIEECYPPADSPAPYVAGRLPMRGMTIFRRDVSDGCQSYIVNPIFPG